MATEPPDGGKREDTEETLLLREEVKLQRHDAEERDAREKKSDAIKNRVSIAAIVLTTALSFIGNVKQNRQDALNNAKEEAESSRRQASELWAYYQTTLAERTSLEVADDRLRLDLKKRGIPRDDPSVKLEALKLTDYEHRVQNIDSDTQQVFYRVQELEKQEDVEQRRRIEPTLAISRYDLASKLITLALILLSVAILSSRIWLFWGGVSLGSLGVLMAFNGYFLFF